MRVITAEPVPQPPLPETMPGGEPWHEETLKWWEAWGRDPLSKDFRELEWEELIATAGIHSRYWNGDFRIAGELRLRTARHGVTAEDRARLRIQYAAADQAEEKQTKRQRHHRYENLRAVDEET